ncbi:MAG: TRAP transporter small permease [Hyphomonas sp.]|nr:TRAP transporter small permease [Hyphomonas sp.]
MLERYTAFCAALARLAMTVAGAGLVAMTAIISWQVFARYVLNNSPSWTEQAALLTLIWFILLAGAAGVHQNFHLRLSLLEDSLPAPQARLLKTGGHLLVALFGLAMTISGAGLTAATWTHVLPALGISRAATYIPVVLAGALITLFAIDRAIGAYTGRKEVSEWN